MGLRGAYFAIGLWFDQPVFPSALLAVGDALVAAGGQYDGDVTVGPSGAEFTSWSNDIDGCSFLDRRVVEGTMAGTVEGTVYRLGLRLPVVGETIVSFASTPTAMPAPEHPVEIGMAADRADRNRSKSPARAFLNRMKALCIALDPAYALMGEEITIPTPAELASGSGHLGWSAFVSHRLATQPGLVAPLAELARLVKTRDWGTGTHYEWRPARTERDREALWAADQAASVAVGRAMKRTPF